MPCPNVPSRPAGTWCNVPAGSGKTACALLLEILDLAETEATANPALMPPGLLSQLTTLLTKCHLNQPLSKLSAQQHVLKVTSARTAAGQHNWTLCISHMEHGH